MKKTDPDIPSDIKVTRTQYQSQLRIPRQLISVQNTNPGHYLLMAKDEHFHCSLEGVCHKEYRVIRKFTKDAILGVDVTPANALQTDKNRYMRWVGLSVCNRASCKPRRPKRRLGHPILMGRRTKFIPPEQNGWTNQRS
jgi:hypothetical protein